MDTPWSELQTLLHCCRCERYLGLNDPGVMGSAWCGECDEAAEVSAEQSPLP
jgi:hypothetical protein